MGRFKADELESGIASLPDSCLLNRFAIWGRWGYVWGFADPDSLLRFAAGDESVRVKPDVLGRTRFNCRMRCILL